MRVDGCLLRERTSRDGTSQDRNPRIAFVSLAPGAAEAERRGA